MFIIFGWNHEVRKTFGPVEPHLCSHCNNTELWLLDEATIFITLFFIPIIPYTSNYFFYCPICNHGTKLDKNDFLDYRSIARVNSDFLKNKISESDREKKLNNIYKSIYNRNEAEKEKLIMKSKEWSSKASEKTSEELLYIINRKSQYNPAYVLAAQTELNNRNSSKSK